MSTAAPERHTQRLLHAANALVRTAEPHPFPLHCLAELWRAAGLAVTQ